MDRKFRKGDMVWAKVRGFPWWPGVIKNIFLKPSKDSANVEKEPHAKVYFVGDSTYIQVPFDKLFRFDSKLPEFSRTKNKRLLKSIAITKKIINGEISFENHLTHYEDTHSDSDEEECEANITTDSVKQASVPTAVTSNDKEKLLGLKRLRKLKGNININININLNNNSNNTVEIIKDKSIEDEDEEFSSESEDERCDPSPSDEIKKAIDKLLRYKIEMPLSTSNKFIVRSLDEIEKILKSNKKLPSHIVIYLNNLS